MKQSLLPKYSGLNSLLIAVLSLSLLAIGSVRANSLTKLEKIHYQIINQTPIYEHEALNDIVQRVGERVARNSNEPGVIYNFFILDDPVVNAFTTGEGYVYINRGLLALMMSEGQLAALLAHEIAHNTERHGSRKKALNMWDNVATIASLLLTGSTSIGDAIKVSNQARARGFGREMELEADGRGAEYMYRANYDPQEMLGMLSVLKDDERFRDVKSLKEGGNATYHGVFSSHPRTDKRLQQIVLKAGSLPPGESFQGRVEMRKALNGVVYGKNYNGNKPNGYERFTHKGLGITFLYPEKWHQTTKGKDIILKDPNKTVQLKLSVEKTIDKTLSSNQILSNKYPEGLSDVRPIHQTASRKKSRKKNQQTNNKDLGTTARKSQQRVAAVTVGRNSFYFQGIAKDNQLTDARDLRFMEIIQTFRRADQNDLPPTELRTLYYERWEPGMTFMELAKGRELGTFTEERLRLMNGYYPKGQPEPGMWVKRVKVGPPLSEQELKDK